MSIVTVAGILLVALPIAFNAAFAALAATFDYPEILRRPTAEILDRFRRGGTKLVLLWWGFAMTAVLLVPLAVVLASEGALRRSAAGSWTLGPSHDEQAIPQRLPPGGGPLPGGAQHALRR
jgi:hypothetical protein